MSKGLHFNSRFPNLRRRKSVLAVDAVGAEEAFGKIVLLQGSAGLFPDDDFRRAFVFAAGNEHPHPVVRKLLRVEQGVGDEGGIPVRKKPDDHAGGRPAVEVDKIIVRNQRCRVFGDAGLGFRVKLFSVADGIVPGAVALP